MLLYLVIVALQNKDTVFLGLKHLLKGIRDLHLEVVLEKQFHFVVVKHPTHKSDVSSHCHLVPAKIVNKVSLSEHQTRLVPSVAEIISYSASCLVVIHT